MFICLNPSSAFPTNIKSSHYELLLTFSFCGSREVITMLPVQCNAFYYTRTSKHNKDINYYSPQTVYWRSL